MIFDSNTRDDRLLAAKMSFVVLRSTDRKPLAVGRDAEAIARLACRIQPVTGEWRAVVERRGR